MQIGDFVALEVKRTRLNSVLLDWGREEMLPLPQLEQRGELRKGDKVVVYITEDDRVFARPMATMHLNEHFKRDTSRLAENQEVQLLIFGVSDLGYDAVVDNRYRGLLYHNEVFGTLDRGDSLTAYIKKVRDDGKLDLMTQLRGTRGTTDLGSVIKDELRARGGFLPLTDKSPPGEIYEIFGVSKKKFKMAVGRLYKHRDVILESDGIRLSEGR